MTCSDTLGDVVNDVDSQRVERDQTSVLSALERPIDRSTVDVTLVWGGAVLRVERLKRGDRFTVGTDRAASLRLPLSSLPRALFELVQVTEQGARIGATPALPITIDGAVHTDDVVVPLGGVARIALGPVLAIVQYAKPYAKRRSAWAERVDVVVAKVFAAALLLQLGVVVALAITPTRSDPEASIVDAQRLTWSRPKPPAPPPTKAPTAAVATPALATAPPQQDAPTSSSRAASQRSDREVAMAALRSLGLGSPAGPGTGALASAIDEGLRGLRGSASAGLGGGDGLAGGTRGVGGGGESLGIGSLRGDTPTSADLGAVPLMGRKAHVPVVAKAIQIVTPGLSREEIQRVLSRSMGNIKHCYSQQLGSAPDLEGKLLTSFTIAGQGDVAAATAVDNSLAGAAGKDVAGCVVRVLSRLKFPSPGGGGQVVVTYPFVFSTSP